jgi:Uma2 family endonuclease
MPDGVRSTDVEDARHGPQRIFLFINRRNGSVIISAVATSTHRRWTDEQLLALPHDGKYELVDGELLHMSPAGYRHGRIVIRLSSRLEQYAASHKLGAVLDGQTGFRFPDGNLRSPDISFLAAIHLPPDEPAGFLHGHPDLAVEVLSPTDRAADVARKVAEYLAEGIGLLWVIDPEQERAVVYRPGAAPRSVGKDEALDGEDVLPGFRCPLRDLIG